MIKTIYSYILLDAFSSYIEFQPVLVSFSIFDSYFMWYAFMKTSNELLFIYLYLYETSKCTFPAKEFEIFSYFQFLTLTNFNISHVILISFPCFNYFSYVAFSDFLLIFSTFKIFGNKSSIFFRYFTQSCPTWSELFRAIKSQIFVSMQCWLDSVHMFRD